MVFVKRGVKAQITIIVILTLVVVFVFGFMMLVKNIMVRQQLSSEARNTINDYISKGAFNTYVTSCLDEVSDDAIISITLQGGIMDFAGKTQDTDYVPFYNPTYNLTRNVSIAIVPNTGCPLVYDSPSAYPYPGRSVNDLIGLYDSVNFASCNLCPPNVPYCYMIRYGGFFGMHNLTKLCYWNGSNRIGATSTLTGYQTCRAGLMDSFFMNFSIQKQLQDYISRNMSRCVGDFADIMARSSITNVHVINNPTTEVTFVRNGINIRLTYPMEVIIQNGQPVIEMVDFSVEKNIPLQELYTYIFYLIRDDLREVTFNITGNATRPDLMGYYFGYQISKWRNVENYVDVIEIMDNNTYINNKPLIFQFGIMNRRPALDVIHYVSNNSFDILALTNDTVVIDPQGYDPDDDAIYYNYSGWKETYDDMFNFGDPHCLGNDMNYIIANCTSQNISVPLSSLNKWTKSTLYNTTKQNASISLRGTDKGFHTVQVKIWDREGLFDWQDVRILVLDMPSIRIKFNNFYPDVSDDHASWEDPFLINGSGSIVGSGSTDQWASFNWTDSWRQIKIVKTIIPAFEDTMMVYLPRDINTSTPINMTSIYNLVFMGGGSHPPYIPNRFGIDNITLVARSTLGITARGMKPVNVSQCLPHRTPPSPIYPYNTGDPFFGTHSCCADDFTYRPAGWPCYINVSYGGIFGFTNFSQRQPMPPSVLPIIWNTGTPPFPTASHVIPSYSNKIDNDIFNRTFTRSCSGDRGNICNGTAQETRNRLVTCNDGGVQRCSGPPVNSSGIFNNSATPVVCQNYPPGWTFELLAKINGATGTGYDTATGFCAGTSSCALLDYRACGSACNGAGGCNSITCICSVNTLPCMGINIYGFTARDKVCNGLGVNDISLRNVTGARMCYGNLEQNCTRCDAQDVIDNGHAICRSNIADSPGNIPRVNCNADLNCEGAAPSSYVTNDQTNWCSSNCTNTNCNGFKVINATNPATCVPQICTCGTYPCPSGNCAPGYRCVGLNTCGTNPN